MDNVEDLRALNNTLAALAKAGNTAAVNQLWEINQRFIHKQVWALCENKTDYLAQHGLTWEDVDNEMYFAVVDAVERYDPARAGFLGCLTWMIRKRFSQMLIGEHTHTYTNKDGARVKISANPLNISSSLDVPIGEDPGESGTTLLDMVKDPEGEAGFISVDETAEKTFIQEEVRAAVNELPENQRAVIELHYLSGLNASVAAVSERLGIPCSKARNAEASAFRKLARNPHIRKVRNELIEAKAYRHTSLEAWASGAGSVEEWLVERQEASEGERARRKAQEEEARRAAIDEMKKHMPEELKAQRANLVARMGKQAGDIFDGLLLNAYQSTGGNGGTDRS